MNKKTMVISGAVIALIVGLSQAPQIKAFWPFGNDDKTTIVNSSQSAPMQSMIQKITSRFGLNQVEVNTAIDEFRTERQAEAKQQFESNLEQAVNDGKITEEQKNFIMEKHTTISSKQDEATQLRVELHTWAVENNIDLPSLGNIRARGMGGGQGMGRSRGGNW